MQLPGEISGAMLQELKQYVVADPYPFVLDLERSEGMWIATVDGQRIFDWAGCYGSRLLGYNHPGLADPAYVQRLVRAANHKLANPDFLTAECLDYYRALHSRAPRCMRNPNLEVYVVNSGAEAVENMMKYMLNLYDNKMRISGKEPVLKRFIYFDQAFHGRTVFALNITQLTHDPLVTRGFSGLVPGNIQVPFPSVDSSQPAGRNEHRTAQSLQIIEECLEKYGDEVVGIVVEPIQGAGGHRVAAPEFFRGLSVLAHRFGVYLGFDEVQTAGGQVGDLFAVDVLDLPYPPQAVAVAKKFGNGALYMLESMDDKGVLDSTWGGSLADMVRVTRELEILEQDRLVEQVAQKSAALIGGLVQLERDFFDRIFNVRGLGLYQGFTFRTVELQRRFLDTALSEEDLLILPAGSQTVRLRPAITVTEEEIRLFLEKVRRVLASL